MPRQDTCKRDPTHFGTSSKTCASQLIFNHSSLTVEKQKSRQSLNKVKYMERHLGVQVINDFSDSANFSEVNDEFPNISVCF